MNGLRFDSILLVRNIKGGRGTCVVQFLQWEVRTKTGGVVPQRDIL